MKNKSSSSGADSLAFWEERFPGKGKALNDLLLPMRSWKLEVTPSLPDLASRAKQAVFWRRVDRVLVFRLKDVCLPQASILQGMYFWAFENEPVPQPDIEESLWELFEDSFWAWHGSNLDASLKTIFQNVLDEAVIDGIMGSLWIPMFSASGFILADQPEKAAKFKPLLDLWLSGNFPIGFNNRGNILVLVAD